MKVKLKMSVEMEAEVVMSETEGGFNVFVVEDKLLVRAPKLTGYITGDTEGLSNEEIERIAERNEFIQHFVATEAVKIVATKFDKISQEMGVNRYENVDIDGATQLVGKA